MKQLDVFALESYHMNYLFNEIEINHSQKKPLHQMIQGLYLNL